jgi:hypothetical protein
MKRFIYVSVILTILTGIVLTNYSCKPEAPPKAVVFVVDEDGVAVEGAMVIVKAANSDSAHTVVYLLNEAKPVADTQWTNDEGKIYYDFKYEAIYKVEVTKDTDRDHPFARRGIGILILENAKTIESKIEINEQTVF